MIDSIIKCVIDCMIKYDKMITFRKKIDIETIRNIQVEQKNIKTFETFKIQKRIKNIYNKNNKKLDNKTKLFQIIIAMACGDNKNDGLWLIAMNPESSSASTRGTSDRIER